MVSKDLMRDLSLRLEPVRKEFGQRKCQWSISILEQQVSEDASLFWRVPSRVIRNLLLLHGNDQDERLRFFLISHGCSHREVRSSPSELISSSDEVLALMRRCVDPTELDINGKRLLPLSMPIPGLNRRRLHVAVTSSLRPEFKEETDPAEPSEWLYEVSVGRWSILGRISSGAHSQLDLSFDVLLGMGDLYLDRQLSLHRVFGIGPSAWDLGEPGDEETIGHLAGEYSRFMLSSLSALLNDLDPGITKEEVVRAEKEWKQWLAEVRARRV